MTKAFIIRFHYEENDPRFAWRLEYFKKEVLPRILAQEPHDFEIAIRCNPAHDQIFKDLSPRIRTFHVRNEGAKYKGRYFYDFVPWSEVIDLPRYDIQFGLDSDDLIAPGYLDTAMEILSVPAARGESAHLCFQPELFDTKTGKVHPIPQRYNTSKGSAFFAIYQPAGAEPYRFAYEESHLTIGRHFAHRIVSGASDLCFASCHDLNESTHI